MKSCTWQDPFSPDIILDEDIDDVSEDDLQIVFDGKETVMPKRNLQNATPADNTMDNSERAVESPMPITEDYTSLDVATCSEKFSWINDYGVHPAETEGVKECYEVRIDRSRQKNPKVYNKLDASILANFRSGYQKKMKLRQELQYYISELWRGPISLVISGSTVNGCASNDADLDMCLCIPERNRNAVYNQNRGFATKNLKMVRRKLCRCSLVSKVLLIRAKVPILRILCKKPYAGIEIDLNVNNVIGIHNSHLLHYYSRVDDRFSVLCFAVKQWAKVAGINDASLGMLNSYSLNLMVLHFLQVASCPPVLPNLQKIYPKFFDKRQPLSNLKLFSEFPFPLPESPGMKNDKTVGELFIGFFDYYSKFNFAENAISICKGKVFPRINLPRCYDKYFVYIEEPFDGLNTARSVTGEGEWLTIHTSIIVQNQLSKELSRVGELLAGTSCLGNDH